MPPDTAATLRSNTSGAEQETMDDPIDHPDDVTTTKVVILGAGAAGLQCAAHLLETCPNTNVLILEARDRIGGRIFSALEKCHTVAAEDGEREVQQFVRDHGAAWVHGTGHVSGQINPMVPLLEQANEKLGIDPLLIPIFEGNPWTRPHTMLLLPRKISIYMDGEALEYSEEALINKSIHRHYDSQRQLAAESDRLFDTGEGMKTVSLSMKEAASRLQKRDQNKTWNGAKLGKWDPRISQLTSFYSFLGCENWDGQSACDLQVSSVVVETDENECINSTTTRITDETFIGFGDFEGPHCKVSSGMTTMLQPLIETVGRRRIRLNDPVTRVQFKDCNDSIHKIEVETTSGFRVEADYCVSTIPLGCLQQSIGCPPLGLEPSKKSSCRFLSFEPPLSADKQEAIRSISSGAYKKVFLTFDDIFWPIDTPLVGLIRSSESAKGSPIGNNLLVNNLWAKSGIPCLEAVLAGRAGKWATRQSDEAIKREVLQFLEDAMGISTTYVANHLLVCHITRWEEDPFTLGSYSSFHLGTLERHVESFSKPEWDGRLLFAGECTESEHMGGVHAALLSARRVSNSLLELMASDGDIR